MQTYTNAEIINIGSGEGVTILELAQRIQKVVCYQGNIVTDPSKPDGIPRKLLDISLLTALEWKAKTDLEAGIRLAYNDYLENNP